MKKIVLSLFVSLSASSVSAAASLDCSQIERHRDKHGALTYFKEVEYENARTRALDEKQSRKAVADFYGVCGIDSDDEDRCYRSSMTFEEVDELGEGIYRKTVAGRDGRLYRQVSVGFGGGNSATYYFRFNTLEFLPFMITDGMECGSRPGEIRPY